MNILQLSPQVPFPPTDGGKIGIYNIYKSFVELGCKVTLVAFTNTDVSNETQNKYVHRNTIFLPIILDSRNTKFRIFKHFIFNQSLYIEKHYNKNLISIIESKIDLNQIDIIHADHSNMAKLGLEIGRKYNIPVGLRLHNVEYIIWKRYYDELKFYDPKRFFILQQYKLLKKAEAKLINDVDIAFAITEVDKKRAKSIATNANIVTVPAGVDTNVWSKEDSPKEQYSLVIATTFNWIHNVNALNWFLDEVLGKLKSNFNKVSLNIIGKNPPDFINRYKTIGANALGFVDDVKPYIRESEVYIAPLFVGSGIRIKILEAMALGLPVVATDISAEGINADDNDGLFRANTAKEYIDIITKLFNDEALRKSSGEKARIFIENNHVWLDLISSMKKEYQSILALKQSNT